MFKSIQKRIFVSYLVVTFSLFFFSYYALYRVESGSLLNQAIENSLRINEIYAGETSSEIIEKIEQLERVAADYKDVFDQRAVLEDLDALVNNPHYGFLTNFYTNTEGQVFFSTGEVNNSADRAYFVEMMKNKPRYVISKPILGRESQQEVFVVGVPLYSAGEFKGMIAGSTALSSISEVINNKKMPLNSYAWIVESDGLVVAHPNENIRMTTNLEDNLAFVSMNGKTIWDEMYGRSHGSVRYIDHNIEKEKVLTFYEIDHTNGWILGITTLIEDITQPIESFKTVILITALVTLSVLGWMNYRMSNIMVEPIVELTRAVSAATDGHIRRIKLTDSQGEVGVLVDAYNKMAEAIERHTTDLEHEVEKRTLELRSLTEKLESQNVLLTKSNTELYSIASTDQLTGLINRRYLFREMDDLRDRVELEALERFSLIFLDLDNFKYYNDRFGHNVGDNLLQTISRIIKHNFRQSDIVGRYGGDEFVVLMPDASREVAEEAANKLVEYIEDKEGFYKEICGWMKKENCVMDLEKVLGCSYGIITYTKGKYPDVDSLVMEADQLMYENKKDRKST